MTNDLGNQILSACIQGDAVVIAWADGHYSTFHFIWLRDNCECQLCGSHTSGTRFQALLDIPDTIAPSSLTKTSDGLSVVWANDSHKSLYQSAWLRQRCYSSAERARRRRPVTQWRGNLEPLPRVDYSSAQKDASVRRKIFANVWELGFVIMENVGVQPEEIELLAEMIGYIRDTHFGRIGDLKLRPDPGMIANFPVPLLAHSDETYRPVPSGIIIFQCLQESTDGGGRSTLVDSYACVDALRRDDPEAFALLCHVPIQHERYTHAELLRSSHPVITLDSDGGISSVRLNERTMSALSIPENLMKPTYSALKKLLRVVYAPENATTYMLRAGEALVFDNMRVLHGRTAFKSARHLRQCNVMRDEFFGKFEYLDHLCATATGLDS